jgi:subtilisin family serine protease
MIFHPLSSQSRSKRGHRSNVVPVLFALLIAPAGTAEGLASEEERTERREATWRAKVDPWVLESASRFGAADFLAFFDEQADLGTAARLATKEEKGRFVFERLTTTAKQTQSELLRILAERQVEYRSFWIANMIWMRGGIEVVEEVASRPEVTRLFASPSVELERPIRDTRNAIAGAVSIEPNILHTRAPSEFWVNGFAGEGVVIGGQDTGYDWQHPALISSYRGWDGQEADHNYNWHDSIHSGGGRCGPDTSQPCDDGSHGTHTMGTIVGDDGAGSQIGLAPKARWIGCRNMDQGVGTPATYSECFEWFVAPTDLSGRNPDPSKAPDIINNSWTCPPSEGCTEPNALRTVVENTRAAGILVIASAGNNGPSCWTIQSPIAIYDAVLTVGATDNADEIAGFSSKGSVEVDGSGRMKPDIVAPGVAIRSSVPGDSYDRFNGTSMASPHVTGMAALVLSAAECKRGRPRRLEEHLRNSALPRPATLCLEPSSDSVPNYTYGYGALRAVLPTCAHDGRIAGFTSAIDGKKVTCRNKTSGDKRSIKLGGLGAWNCMARGFAASSDDKILLKLTGSARDAGLLAGRVDGLETMRALCRNRTTGRKIKIPLAGKASWNCEAAGLNADAGDKLKVTVLGRASADS